MFNFIKPARFFAVLFLLLSTQAVAERTLSTSIIKSIETGIYSVGIGSQVNLKTEDLTIKGPAVFLGNTILPDRTNSYQMFLNEESKRLLYISPDQFNRLSTKNLQKVLDSYEQTGGTCSAYAINNFLQQTSLTGFVGTGALEKIVKTEEGRTWLLADAINEYYLTMSHRYSLAGILNKYGKKFGFNCKKTQTDSFEKVSDLLKSHLVIGSPVIISYNIGPDMVNGPFNLEAYNQKDVKFDQRLWIPRRVGERNNGGHTIVATGAFTSNNKTYLVIIDSDWSEPRVWDVEEYLNHKKTALEEIEFITCKL